MKAEPELNVQKDIARIGAALKGRDEQLAYDLTFKRGILVVFARGCVRRRRG